MQWLVVADTQHPREPHRDAALVARAAVDALETQLKDQRGLDAAHRAELLERGPADDGIDLPELLVRQARISFGEGHQLQRIRLRRLTPRLGFDRGLGLAPAVR